MSLAVSRWSALLKALREPGAMATFDESTWDLVVRQATSARLLGRLGALARQSEIEARIPTAVQRHLSAALSIAEQQQRAVRWEVVQLERALEDLPGPVLLLKGAAYAAADLPPATGRLFGDIDILVPKTQIDAAEAALMLDGWVSVHRDAYDQRYYRQWMHEIPPMTHIRRRTVLDLHHAILPETARIRTRSDSIIEYSRPLSGSARFRVPQPADLVLHSATHLFHEGEWQHGLRDLVDLDAMLRAYGDSGSFWALLIARADQLGLGRPLFHALRCCHLVAQTPVPADALANCPDPPNRFMIHLLDQLFVRGASSGHRDSALAGTGLATFALYVRSHWLRMPMHLLLPHLARKSWQRRIAPHLKPRTAVR